MYTRQDVRAVPVMMALVVSIALTGCGDGEQQDPAGGPARQGSSESSPQPQAQATTEASQVPYDPLQREVQVLDVLAPDLVVVTPVSPKDPMLDQQFTVRVTGIDVPAEGECGYEEALAATEHYMTDMGTRPGFIEGRLGYDVPDDDPETTEVEMITDEGLHQASFGRAGTGSPSLRHYLVENGYALPGDEISLYSHEVTWNEEAKEQGLGLYGLCEGY